MRNTPGESEPNSLLGQHYSHLSVDDQVFPTSGPRSTSLWYASGISGTLYTANWGVNYPHPVYILIGIVY